MRSLTRRVDTVLNAATKRPNGLRFARGRIREPIRANVGSIHGPCRGGGSNVGGSRTAPTGFVPNSRTVRMYFIGTCDVPMIVRDYDGCVRMIRHTAIRPGGRTGIVPPTTTNNSRLPAHRHSSAFRHQQPSRRRAPGHRCRRSRNTRRPSCSRSLSAGSTGGRIGLATFQRGPSIGTRRPTH